MDSNEQESDATKEELRFARQVTGRTRFIASVPAIGLLIAAVVLAIATLIGVVVAGVTGYFAIRFFLKLISRVSLNWFALYVIVLGIVIIVLQMTGVMTDAPTAAAVAAMAG